MAKSEGSGIIFISCVMFIEFTNLSEKKRNKKNWRRIDLLPIL